MSAPPAPPPPTIEALPERSAFLRLASCPQCAGRRRVLVEVADEVRGRCLECGAELSVPLATERHSRLVVVGRAGQGILEVDD